ncbi:MAG: hypothetical protein DRJ10_08630 [Bacteroidetes bacterium]|nr:MAG: hypothetical protein DRJ10_08630 [Bacteroidota bacterium]
MPQFVAYNNKVEVNGQTIQSFIKGVTPQFRQKVIQILANNGISNLEKLKWYNQQEWLNAFKQIYDTIGSHTLFSIGKAIPDSATFPENIVSLRDALQSIDIAYHNNHKGGEIGYYRLTKFNELERKAMMVCKNPYPCPFDRGIITSIVRKFKPVDSLNHEVELDKSSPDKLDDEESRTYLISW